MDFRIGLKFYNKRFCFFSTASNPDYMLKESVIFLLLLLYFGLPSAFGKTARYRAMWREDPSTTMVIGWDQISGANPVVFFDVADHGLNVNQYSFSQKADYAVLGKGMNNHFARLTNLIPNTIYYFIIKDSEGLSKRMSFQTMSDFPGSSLSIIAGGDSRNHREARINANKLVSKLRPSFILFTGDMTESDSAEEWMEWMDDWQYTNGADGQLFPIVVCRGNHEASNESLTKLFDLKNPDIYYSLSFGGSLLKIFTLNTQIPSGGDQRLWLAKNLETSQSFFWRIAQYHQTMRPHTSKKAENNQLIVDWATLFYKYNVQVAVESDAHVVKWTYPIRPSKEPGAEEGFIQDENGTVYIGEGGWGAPLRANDDNKSWTRDSDSFNQFKLLFVNEEKIEIRTLKIDLQAEVENVSPYDIFKLPKGIDKILWKPAHGAVLTIKNPAYKGPPMMFNNGVKRGTGNSVVSGATDPEVLYPDKNSGNIDLRFTLKDPFEVFIVLKSDPGGKEVARIPLGKQEKGDFFKSINFSKISKGKYELTIETPGGVVKKFKVIHL